jgi:hypothetical protein
LRHLTIHHKINGRCRDAPPRLYQRQVDHQSNFGCVTQKFDSDPGGGCHHSLHFRWQALTGKRWKSARDQPCRDLIKIKCANKQLGVARKIYRLH